MSQEPASHHTPESWSAASRGYAEEVAPRLMRPFVEAMVDRLDVDAESEVVEVAAGSGVLTEVLSSRVKSVTATDFSPGMIEVLRERMDRAGATNVRTSVMDGQALDFDDSTFDAAACSFALMLFADRACGFRELCRVVRPGGRAAVTGWAGPDRFEAFGIFLSAVRAAFPDMPRPTTPPPVLSLADPVRFRGEMEAAGFRDVEVEFVDRELAVDGFEHGWSLLTAGAPPVQVLFDRVGPEGRERVRDEYRRLVEDRFGQGSFALRNTATLGWGSAS